MPAVPIEIYEEIFNRVVADNALSNDFDPRATAFHEYLPPYSPGRSHLATNCALVSTEFYDIIMPIVWRYLVVRSEDDLDALLHSSSHGLSRSTRRPVVDFVQRIDFRSWRDISISKSMMLLTHFPNLRILALESRTYPGPLWRHPLTETFYRYLPSLCPKLRRLQLLHPRETPTLEELASISRRCKELRSLHVVHLTNDAEKVLSTLDDSDTDDSDTELVSLDYRGECYEHDETTESEDTESADDPVHDPRGESEETSSEEELASVHSDFRSEDEEAIETQHFPGDERIQCFGENPAMAIFALAGFLSRRKVEEMEEEQSVVSEVFEFHKLERLALGMGNVHSLLSERISMCDFALAIAPYRSQMTALKEVFAYVSLDDVKDGLRPFSDILQRSVLHMYVKSRPTVYASFSNIRRLSVVLYSTYVSLPRHLDHLEEFDLLIRRPVFVNDYNKPSVSKRMARGAQAVLNALLNGIYPNLKMVAVWKCTLMHHAEIDILVEDNRARFSDMGVGVEARMREVVFRVPEWYYRAHEPCAQTV